MAGNLSISNSKLLVLVKLTFFLTLLFIADYSIGDILRHFYFTQKSGIARTLTYSIEQSNEDIIIFGSSRAVHHYNPEVFEKTLGMSCFNSGRDGLSILFYRALEKAILNRYAPKIIILDLPSSELFAESTDYDRLSCLLPYYKTHTELRPFIEMRGKLERLKLLSRIYPFNGLILSIIKNNIVIDKKIDGFLPLSNIMKPIESGKKIPPSDLKIDPNKVNALRDFIKDAVSRGIRLYIIISPVYELDLRAYDQRSLNMLKEITNEYGVPLWDYTYEPKIVSRAELFSDPGHLNKTGAELFSEIIANRIKGELEDNVLEGQNITKSKGSHIK